MPWKGETQNLFGQVSGFCERHGFRSPHISDADSHQARNGQPKAKTVKIGEELVILTFFVNPKSDAKNNANVVCSIKVIRPDKTVSVNQRGIPCMKGEMKGNPNNIRLSPAVIRFVGERTDPPGEWVVDVEVEDVYRNTRIPLRTRFVLQGSSG